jgi:AcrR family transcriptional regulator
MVNNSNMNSTLIDPEYSETEMAIIQAAKRVFHKNGFDGARMQEIADEAGINKALLHYYFRNKDKLFAAVFKDAFMQSFRPLIQIMMSDEELEVKVPRFVNHYLDQILANPFIPGFVLHELSRNPDRLISLINEHTMIKTSKFIQQIQQGTLSGRYRPIDPKQAVAHLVSMIVFPFIAKPMIKFALGFEADTDYLIFIEARRQEIPIAFFNILKP